MMSIGIVAILLLVIVSASSLIVSINGLSSENLTFTGNQNITRNLTISRWADVSSSYLNLSGYSINSSYFCFQEQSNKSSATDGICTLNYTGTYSYASGTCNDDPCGNWADGNYNTATNINGNSHPPSYVNYSVPLLYNTNAKWFINGSTGSSDEDRIISVPSNCLSSSMLQLKIDTNCSYSVGYQNFSCMNNTGWQLLYNEDCNGGVYGGSHNLVYFQEESIQWNVTSYGYINETYIKINNMPIWNYSLNFDQTNNKTSDFSSSINSASNSTLCNCVGCSLNTTTQNCSIPFTFHSDTAGILEYSDIQINYTAIYVSLSTPANNSYSSTSSNFTCLQYSESQLANSTLNIWNSTNSLIYNLTTSLNGTENSTNSNYTFSLTGAYKWNCLATNALNEQTWASSNYTLNVDLSNVITNLNAPTNTQVLNYSTNIYLNYTPAYGGGGAIDTCRLWINSTGTWQVNQTDASINNNVVNSFIVNSSLGRWLWNIDCNDSVGGTFRLSESGNYTFGVDLANPLLSITSPTSGQTLTSKTFNVVINSSDDLGLSYCYYNITRGASLEVANTQITNCSSQSVTVSSDATYVLNVWVNDTFNKMNTTNQTFTVNTVVIPSGGGTTIVLGTAGFTMETSSGASLYQFKMTPGSARDSSIFMENLGTTALQISLSCENGNGDLDGLCDYVFFDNEKTDLPVLKDAKTESKFSINLPKTIKSGTYIANIYGQDASGNKNVISIEVTVGAFGFLTGAIVKLGNSAQMGGINVPYFLIFMVATMVSGAGIFMVVPNDKKLSLGVIGGLLIGLTALLLI